MKDVSRIRQRVGVLMRERDSLEKKNLVIRNMKKGTLIKHYKKCGGKVCVCREGKLHGPYWYLSYKERDKSILKYVHIKDLIRVRRLAGNYKKFQSNITRINRINKEIGDLFGSMRELLVLKSGRKR